VAMDPPPEYVQKMQRVEKSDAERRGKNTRINGGGETVNIPREGVLGAHPNSQMAGQVIQGSTVSREQSVVLDQVQSEGPEQVTIEAGNVRMEEVKTETVPAESIPEPIVNADEEATPVLEHLRSEAQGHPTNVHESMQTTTVTLAEGGELEPLMAHPTIKHEISTENGAHKRVNATTVKPQKSISRHIQTDWTKWTRLRFGPDRGQFWVRLVPEKEVDWKTLPIVQDSADVSPVIMQRSMEEEAMKQVPEWGDKYWRDESGNLHSREAVERWRQRRREIRDYREEQERALLNEPLDDMPFWKINLRLQQRMRMRQKGGWGGLLRLNQDKIDSWAEERNKEFGL
jgi:hypothetical protein